MNSYDPKEDLILGTETDVITSEQIIGDDFYEDLAQAKEDFRYKLNGYTPVATIPEVIVNKWLREGFDFWSAPANEIIKKLRMEEYDTMIISGDRTF
jgi:hypothetical protein